MSSGESLLSCLKLINLLYAVGHNYNPISILISRKLPRRQIRPWCGSSPQPIQIQPILPLPSLLSNATNKQATQQQNLYSAIWYRLIFYLQCKEKSQKFSVLENTTKNGQMEYVFRIFLSYLWLKLVFCNLLCILKQ